MTAAERQRRCRANGKGRHRGALPTRAQVIPYLNWFREQIAALEAAQGSPATVEQMGEILRNRGRAGSSVAVAEAPSAE